MSVINLKLENKQNVYEREYVSKDYGERANANSLERAITQVAHTSALNLEAVTRVKDVRLYDWAMSLNCQVSPVHSPKLLIILVILQFFFCNEFVIFFFSNWIMLDDLENQLQLVSSRLRKKCLYSQAKHGDRRSP